MEIIDFYNKSPANILRNKEIINDQIVQLNNKILLETPEEFWFDFVSDNFMLVLAYISAAYSSPKDEQKPIFEDRIDGDVLNWNRDVISSLFPDEIVGKNIAALNPEVIVEDISDGFLTIEYNDVVVLTRRKTVPADEINYVYYDAYVIDEDNIIAARIMSYIISKHYIEILKRNHFSGEYFNDADVVEEQDTSMRDFFNALEPEYFFPVIDVGNREPLQVSSTLMGPNPTYVETNQNYSETEQIQISDEIVKRIALSIKKSEDKQKKSNRLKALCAFFSAPFIKKGD